MGEPVHNQADLSTEQVIRALMRPVYVMQMAKGDGGDRADVVPPSGLPPRVRGARVRYQQSYREIEQILSRWRGPDDN